MAYASLHHGVQAVYHKPKAHDDHDLLPSDNGIYCQESLNVSVWHDCDGSAAYDDEKNDGATWNGINDPPCTHHMTRVEASSTRPDVVANCPVA